MTHREFQAACRALFNIQFDPELPAGFNEDHKMPLSAWIREYQWSRA